MRYSCFLFLALLCFKCGTIKAQYKDLHDFMQFDSSDGSVPYGSLIITGKTMYGMTSQGGRTNKGCIFSIDTNGNGFRKLFDFNGTNGDNPQGSLILVGDKLFGMATQGGVNGVGSIFSIDTNGSGFRDMFDFNITNGAYPYGNLIVSANVLYGMTNNGGTHLSGNIFCIDTDGSKYRDLFDFNGTNGGLAYGSLILSGGTLYGVTEEGGASFNGNVFSIDTNGNGFNDLFDFDGVDGKNPMGSLTLFGSKLFGTTREGGIKNVGTIFSIDTNGNGFKKMFDFDSINGSYPWSEKLALSGKVLCGMTSSGGVANNGIIFSIDTDGSGFYDVLEFNFTNGSSPLGSLTLSPNNTMFGMTSGGGAHNGGIIFGLADMALGINKLRQSSSSIKVFPNPSSGIFTIAFVGAQNFVPDVIEIYNVMGQRVESEKIKGESEEIDLSSQPNGVYFYRALSETGALIGEGKVIIQR